MYQALFRKNAGERKLLMVGWATTFFIGGGTTVIAVIMAASGQSVFQIMLTFNTLMFARPSSPALLGLVVRRTPPWSGLASFASRPDARNPRIFRISLDSDSASLDLLFLHLSEYFFATICLTTGTRPVGRYYSET